MNLQVVGNHQGEDGGHATVGDEDDGERGDQGDGDRPLRVLRLLPARGDRVEADEAVEAGRRSGEHPIHSVGEEAALPILSSIMTSVERPIVEVGVDEAEDCDKEHDSDVEAGEDVVEPRRLLHAEAEDDGEEEGDAKGEEVGVGRDVVNVDR